MEVGEVVKGLEAPFFQSSVESHHTVVFYDQVGARIAVKIPENRVRCSGCDRLLRERAVAVVAVQTPRHEEVEVPVVIEIGEERGAARGIADCGCAGECIVALIMEESAGREDVEMAVVVVITHGSRHGAGDKIGAESRHAECGRHDPCRGGDLREANRVRDDAWVLLREREPGAEFEDRITRRRPRRPAQVGQARLIDRRRLEHGLGARQRGWGRVCDGYREGALRLRWQRRESLPQQLELVARLDHIARIEQCLRVRKPCRDVRRCRFDQAPPCLQCVERLQMPW